MRAITFIILILAASYVLACASPGMILQESYGRAMDLYEKQKALKEASCGKSNDKPNYEPKYDDPRIARILLIALDDGIDEKVIIKVITTYECLYAVRADPEYAKLKTLLSEEAYAKECDFDRINSMRIISAKSGVNLRVAPDVTSKRIGGIVNGDPIQVIAKEGAWLKVKTYWQKGYVHEDGVGGWYYEDSVPIAPKRQRTSTRKPSKY